MKKFNRGAALSLMLVLPLACGGDNDDGGSSSEGTDTAAQTSEGDDGSSSEGTDTAAQTSEGDNGSSSEGTDAVAQTTEVAEAPGDDEGASGRIVLAGPFEYDTLDPHVSSAAKLMSWSINETLIDYDDDGVIVPVLAASVPEPVDGDPTRWRVELQEGISFTNGEPFDASAVVANVERILDPTLGSELLSELETIDHAEAVDEYTVEFVTTEPDPILDYRLGILQIVPPVASQDDDYSNNPIGTGPMVFDSWQRGERVLLQANPDYWGDPKPTIEEVEIRFIPDEGTRVSALRSGEIDIAIDIPPGQVSDLPASIESSAPTQMSMMRINLAEAPYSDPNFRRALAYAIDSETINDTLFDGQYGVNRCQPVSPTTFGFNDSLEPYPYDPATAEELLAEVELPDGFTLQFDTGAGIYPQDRELAEAIASYWRAVGLDVDVTFNEVDPWLDKLFGLTSDVLYLETDQAIRNSARQVGLYVAPDGQGSQVGATYPELVPLIETATTAIDNGDRQQAYEDIWELVCDEAMVLYNLDRVEIWGASERINYEPRGGALNRISFNRVQITD